MVMIIEFIYILQKRCFFGNLFFGLKFEQKNCYVLEIDMQKFFRLRVVFNFYFFSIYFVNIYFFVF